MTPANRPRQEIFCRHAAARWRGGLHGGRAHFAATAMIGERLTITSAATGEGLEFHHEWRRLELRRSEVVRRPGQEER